MLKIIAVIECDICNGVLTNIAVAKNTDSQLAEKIHDLQIIAEETGWHAMQNATVHHCSDCLHPN
jgi:hypothetical protein